MPDGSPLNDDDLLLLPPSELGKLTSGECWWRDHQIWLAERGYMLRPRYRPDWEPSWKKDPGRSPMGCEDWYSAGLTTVLDAVRISDNSLVALKKVTKTRNPHEISITQYLSSDALKSDHRNHTVPILDILPVPDDADITLLVMPLFRLCNDPRWRTVGEVIAFLFQIFEGMEFMHELNVAHRDCQQPNIMYDPRPIYPAMFHPRQRNRALNWKDPAKHSTRTDHPVRYYYIDFGLSRKYNPEDGPPREIPIRGGDKTVPEFQSWKGEPLDPFPTDIYYLGNMIRMTILQEYRNVEFLSPLVEDMVRTDPSERPTIQEVVRRFRELSKSLGYCKLRSRLVPRDEHASDRFDRSIVHAIRTARYILARKSAIPLPR
ncbi:hypothetical protein BV20DRAFT_975753 [Pilatotrama ljubarskyi]|nr:hypothetical protein BV20DRAFT_975753 [Pilatotrama ljubarskyi]